MMKDSDAWRSTHDVVGVIVYAVLRWEKEDDDDDDERDQDILHIGLWWYTTDKIDSSL
jgi:hypothetical protein